MQRVNVSLAMGQTAVTDRRYKALHSLAMVTDCRNTMQSVPQPDQAERVSLSLWSRMRLRAALFLSGAAVMVLEILGTRIIGPHFGVGLFVWTSLITVTLVALALGYWLGGMLADRWPSPGVFAAVLLAAAFAVALIPLWRGPVLDAAWVFGLRSGSLCAAGALFFPPLLLLGMISPFAVRLEAEGVAQAGRSAGRLYAISTAGSVFGALLTGFVLVPALRVPTILAIQAGALVFAALLAAAPGLNKRVAGGAIAVVLGAIVLAWPSPQPAGLLALRSCNGSDLRVIAHEGSRYLFVDQTVQTSIDSEGRSNEEYIYIFAADVLLARPHAKSAALIGLGGGGIIPLLSAYGLDLEVADLSPGVIDLARSHFGLSLPPSKVHAIDGRVFLKQRPARFDAIVLDVFNGDRLALSLVSLEALQCAKEALTQGGLLALNTWGLDSKDGRPNQLGAAIRVTLQQVFRHVAAVQASGNLLFFASDSPLDPGNAALDLPTYDGVRSFSWLEMQPTSWPLAALLTDDWNPLDVLDASAVEAIRAGRRATNPPLIRDALGWE